MRRYGALLIWMLTLTTGASVTGQEIPSDRASEKSFKLTTNALKIARCEWPLDCNFFYNWSRMSRPTKGLDSSGMNKFFRHALSTNRPTFGRSKDPGIVLYGVLMGGLGEDFGFDVLSENTIRFYGASNEEWVISSGFNLPLTEGKHFRNASGRLVMPRMNDIKQFQLSPCSKRRKDNGAEAKEGLRIQVTRLLGNGKVKHFNNVNEVNLFHSALSHKEEHNPSLDDFVDGYFITRERDAFFWELYLSKYLFLQDERGRMCVLLPK